MAIPHGSPRDVDQTFYAAADATLRVVAEDLRASTRSPQTRPSVREMDRSGAGA